MTRSHLLSKITLAALLLFFLLNFSPTPTYAQIFNEDKLELQLLSNEKGTLFVELRPSLSEPGRSILAEISHPEFLIFKNLHNGDIGCEPELLYSETSALTLYCSLPKDIDGFTNGVAVQIEFDVIEYGDGEVLIEYAEVDNFEVSGTSLQLISSVGQASDSSRAFGLSGGEGLTWLLLVAGGSIFIIMMIIFSRKRKNTTDDQLVFASLVGMLILSVFSAILINSPASDFDLREEASFEVCKPECTGRECGSDGCGGECGSCTEGDICDQYGFCSPDPRSEEGVNEISEPSEESELNVDSDKSMDVEGVSDTNISDLREDSFEAFSRSLTDINRDGVTDMYDHSLLLDGFLDERYGLGSDLSLDLNGDGEITYFDIILMQEVIQSNVYK